MIPLTAFKILKIKPVGITPITRSGLSPDIQAGQTEPSLNKGEEKTNCSLYYQYIILYYLNIVYVDGDGQQFS